MSGDAQKKGSVRGSFWSGSVSASVLLFFMPIVKFVEDDFDFEKIRSSRSISVLIVVQFRAIVWFLGICEVFELKIL